MSGLGTLSPTQPISIDEAMRQLTVAQSAIDYVASRGFMFPTPPQGNYKGMLPFNLDGWIVHEGSAPYQGTLTRNGVVVKACSCSDLGSQIRSDFSP